MSIYKNLCVADEEEVREFIQLVASNIKRIRQEKGVTQLELALMIGQKSSAFYANAENSAKNRRFNLEHIYKISKALDVEVSDFFKK
ncbi:helix-turn-helix transcriptional regulator [Sulfurimonas lithotrophica]|uniref:Helix-turn-helix transcriptional regulator n=1 Tax=Sulfurimonas lithotrophica TaxID=2590022 RepID=A0A5P8P0N1_9BACT|nr:helix-turn-helix transcriptional regulator [Sulfurimonas lithotrophica]QFR49160.1 helix-turn-helix transcriptional regulator [Sulfurimonas lithotrophica]